MKLWTRDLQTRPSQRARLHALGYTPPTHTYNAADLTHTGKNTLGFRRGQRLVTGPCLQVWPGVPPLATEGGVAPVPRELKDGIVSEGEEALDFCLALFVHCCWRVLSNGGS